jgi:hypothetical protein
MYEVLRQGDIRKVYKLVAAQTVYERGDLDGGREVFLEASLEVFLLLFQEQEFPFQKSLQV